MKFAKRLFHLGEAYFIGAQAIPLGPLCGTAEGRIPPGSYELALRAIASQLLCFEPSAPLLPSLFTLSHQLCLPRPCPVKFFEEDERSELVRLWSI